ncbi:peroxiredoxin-like family protein [Paenibacillus hamazuiensis]|uniref:peroxiredoxin-like family protein n=1 Tax=Paenibacillus hamazuiensis TaxID=2936508 RepID=UPI00200FC7C0|nr:peroxiredoxin-like family protein [Paenibacillus hamazuiensis]
MNDYLNKQLETREEALRSGSPAEYQILMQSVEYFRQTGIARGLKTGDPAPAFTLTDALGRTVRLTEETAKGPVVLTFYRGGWCPFCNLQLRAYQEYLPQFGEHGASVIAVSPQSPDNSVSQQEKERLPFIVASDMEGRVAERYHVLYEVEGSLRSLYEKFQIDLAKYNASERWFLPVSATFVIDRGAVIRYAYVDPNFMRRLEPEVILQVLRTL